MMDTITRLHVTNQIEQTLVLLLALRQLKKRAESPAMVTNHLQTQQYWRGELPDFDAVWQEACTNQLITTSAKGTYLLTNLGLSRLSDLCTLAYALREPFHHLTSAGYQAACKVRGEIGERPFISRAGNKTELPVKRGQHHVYVILLRADAVSNHAYLLDFNPERDENYPWLYVGCTGGTPSSRFQKHKHGTQGSQIVRDFGVCLVPDLYTYLNPINGREQAVETERQYAISLRKQGYTITAGHHDWE